MGPRKFLARRIANFLFQHGNLENLLSQQKDECLSVCSMERAPSSLLDLSTVGTHLGSTAPRNEVYMVHLALLFVASMIITGRLRHRTRQRRYVEANGGSLWRWVDRVSLLLARISVRLLAVLCFMTLSRFAVDVLPELHIREHEAVAELLDFDLLWRKLILDGCLWALLLTILPSLSSFIWMLLNPANEISSLFTEKTRLSIVGYGATLLSYAIVLVMAHQEFPLLRKSASGALFLEELGLSQRAVNFLSQVASSFVAYCIFAKCFSPPVSSPTSVATCTPPRSQKKANKLACASPEIINRMATLAQEARARVEQRKKAMEHGGASRGLSRSYSVATFNPDLYHEEDTSRPLVGSRLIEADKPFVSKNLTPQRRAVSRFSFAGSPSLYRRSSLSSLPEQPNLVEEEDPAAAIRKTGISLPYPPSPLMDIHLAGPTLSSKDMFDKLKTNQCLLKRSVSMGCFQESIPKSPTKTHSQEEVLLQYCSRSNPQSSHTPVGSFSLEEHSGK